MSDLYKARLQSSDPAVRRQAIIALGKSGDSRALPLLAQAYKTDPDPSLRELARKAGRHIQQQTASPAAPPAQEVDARYRDYMEAGYDNEPGDSAQYILPVYDDDDGPPSSSGYEIVSRQDPGATISDEARRNAADLARRGLEDFERGKHKESLNNLIAALELNPGLKTDPSVQKAAAGLTGQRDEEAAAILADPLRRSMYIGQVEEKEVERAKQTGGVTWGDVGMDLGILSIVVILSMVLSLVGFNTFMAEAFLASDVPPETIASMSALGLPFILFGAVVAGIGTAIGTLIAYSGIHVVSGFFGGGASLTQTLHALVPIQTALYIASLVLVLVTLFTSLYEIIGLLGFVVSVGGFVWQVNALSRVQGFGWMTGCATIIVAGIVMGILWAAIAFIASAALGGVLYNMVPATTGWLLLPF